MIAAVDLMEEMDNLLRGHRALDQQIARARVGSVERLRLVEAQSEVRADMARLLDAMPKAVLGQREVHEQVAQVMAVLRNFEMYIFDDSADTVN